MSEQAGAGLAPHHYFAPPASRMFPLSHREALKSGSDVIEAEHMLLALAANPATPSGWVLVDAGLDHERLLELLRQERRRSLASAGLEPLSEQDAAVSTRRREVRLGASANLAIQRAAAIGHREQGVRLGRDLLLGILQAEVGTVPRALALGGIDRAQLSARIMAEV
jgi:D-alanyl-D-alanine carboxypeptidase